MFDYNLHVHSKYIAKIEMDTNNGTVAEAEHTIGYTDGLTCLVCLLRLTCVLCLNMYSIV